MAKSSTKSSESAREDIIASIRRNLKISEPFDAVHSEHKHAMVMRRSTSSKTEVTSEALIEKFRENLEAVGGELTVAKNTADAVEAVESIIDKLSAERVAISDSELVATVTRQIAGTEFISAASAEILFDCDLGITAAQWAIAETGTLVLESERESHRLTSLVPAAHLCIVRAANIRYGLGEILELTSRDLSRTITFITGASRTSDIELTLAIGVHGPGKLHVIVVDDQ